ncbi:hypothetical protein LINPERPRIM_LOCUS31817 [Linum perenne]
MRRAEVLRRLRLILAIVL